MLPYIPVYLPQAPEGRSSRSRTWTQTSLWWWGRWSPSVCHMLQKDKGRDGKHLEQKAIRMFWVIKIYYNGFTFIYFRSKWVCLMGSWARPACCSIPAFLLVLCRRCLLFTSHLLMPVFTLCVCVCVWMCEKLRETGNRKGRASVYSAPLCCFQSCCSVN